MVDKVTLVEIENPHPNARPAKLMAHEQELATNRHVDVEATHGTKGHVQGLLEHSCPVANQRGGLDFWCVFDVGVFNLCLLVLRF